MSLFDRIYYGKAGKRDYSEMDMPKNRISLFFLVLKDHFFDLIKVNFLQLVFWIPFIIWTYMNFAVIQNIDTEALMAAENGSEQFMSMIYTYAIVWLLGLIPCVAITGPSSAGAAYVMRNWARDQHAFLFSDYKDAFKSNWKQALAISVISSVIPVLAFTAVTYYSEYTQVSMFMIVPLILVCSATLMWLLMVTLLYPMMVGYELSLKNLLKNALLMAAASLPKVLCARIITFIPVAAIIFGVYTGNAIAVMIALFYYLFFGFAVSRLVYASFAHGVFDRFLNPHIEGAVVGQGLRPQSGDDLDLDVDDDEDDDEDDD